MKSIFIIIVPMGQKLKFEPDAVDFRNKMPEFHILVLEDPNATAIDFRVFFNSPN